MSGNKIVKGAAILGVAGLIVKLLGVFLKIPLTALIGEEGMAYYGYAYPLYSLFLVVATAGIPVAISRLVSEKIAIRDYAGAHNVFKVSRALLLFIGVVSFAICYFGAELIAKYAFGDMGALLPMKAIAPALIFVPVMSAYRGYFQGRQNMNPTAVSQFFEQIIRVGVGLVLAYYLVNVSLEAAAAGATFGATAGSVGGLLIIVIIYLCNKKVIVYHIKKNRHYNLRERKRDIIKQILLISIPITIGAAILPIVNFADSMLVTRRLVAGGFELEIARNMYGQLSAYCNTMVGLPAVLTQAIAVAMVPAVAAAYKLSKTNEVHDNINLGLRISMIMGMPCAVGMAVLAEPILLLLFPANPAGVASAAPTLMIMCISVVQSALLQTTTGVLQAVGKQSLPVVNLAVGAVAKIVFTFALVSVPVLNIKGAAIATVIFYTIALALNFYHVIKYTGVRINIALNFLKPSVAALLMGAAAFAAFKLLYSQLGSSNLSCLIAICVGVVVYGVLILVTKAITKEEIARMPKGDKLVKILDKFIK